MRDAFEAEFFLFGLGSLLAGPSIHVPLRVALLVESLAAERALVGYQLQVSSYVLLHVPQPCGHHLFAEQAD